MIIGISGGSGAGKSTLSRKLSELLPNSLLIVCDNYMRESSRKLEKEIFENLEVKRDPNISKVNYFFKDFESVKTWISTIEREMVYNIESQIQKNKEQKEYIIVDWCFLPLCSFFKKCDYTICIISDSNKRKERLTDRLLNKDNSIHNRNDSPLSSYKPDMYLNRIKYTDLSNYGFNFDYYITNNTTIEEFYNDINELVNKILIS